MKNSRLYLNEIDRILRNNGYFIYITHSSPERRLNFLKANGWKIKTYKLYRSSVEEELIYFEQELFNNSDLLETVAENTEFDKVMSENMTKPQLENFQHKKYHFAYVCQKVAKTAENLNAACENNQNK